MKNILKSLAVLFAGLSMAASCVAVDELATTIKVDKTAVAFEAVSPAAQTVNLTADGDWYVFAPSWVKVTPSHGSGNTAVKIEASANTNEWSEPMAPRSDVLSFWSSDKATAVVEISQNGEAGLDATRNFSKITKKDEWDPTKTSMIVFEVSSGSFSAMLPYKGADETKYSYLFVTPVKPVEGVITYSNSSLAYTFVKKEGGYGLLQSNNYYLFGNASFANFYSTTSLEKADAWSVDFDADGHLLLKNETIGKYIHYSTSYSNVEVIGSAEAILPYLFQDKAAASTEVLAADEKFYIPSSAKTFSIAVDANCKWTVRNHDSWVKTFTKSGEGKGKIEFTMDANTGADRSASFQIIGQEKNITVEVVQSAPITTVESLNKWIATGATSYEIVCKDVLVTYVNGGNAFLEDATGAVLLYLKEHGLKTGDKINGTISGSATIYSGLNELTSMTKGTDYAVVADAAVTPATITLDEFTKNSAKYVSRLVKIAGVEVAAGINSSKKEGSVKVGEASAKIYMKATSAITTGSKGDLTAIPYVNNGGYFLGVWEDAFFEATFLGGAITAKDVTVDTGETVSIGAKVNTDATMTYKSGDETIATVDSDGKVTGIKEGSTTITISAPAGDGYSAAEKEIKVTVNVAAPKISFTMKELPAAYGTTAPGTVFKVGSYELYAFQTANYGFGIQMKKSCSAYVANKTATATKIMSISLSVYEGKTVYTSNLKVYGGTAELPGETEIAATKSDASPYVYDFSAGNYTYFKIVNTSSYACYFDTITVTLAK